MKHSSLLKSLFIGLVIIATTSQLAFSQQTAVGIFDGHSDVGKVLHPGSATYNASTHQYEMSGSGTNIWGNHDEFHFMWKRMKGDFIVYARGQLVGKGVDPHRKIGWMVRSSLDSSTTHINAAVHG